MLAPRDQRVLRHPLGQLSLPRPEREALATSDPPQFEAKFPGEKTSECETKGRSFRVASKVIPNTGREGLLAGCSPVLRGLTRRDAGVQKG